MKGKYCLVSVFIVALLLFPVLAHAELKELQKVQPVEKTPKKLQPAQAVKAEVKSLSTHALKLEAGGKAAAVTLQGSNLNKITDCRVLLGNRPVKDIEVILGPSSTKVRKMTLKAKATAKPEGNYTLQLLAGKEVIEVPVTFEIVSPKLAQAPVSPLGSPSEEPQPTPAPLPGEDRPALQHEPTEPAHPAQETTPVHGIEAERVEDETPIPLQIYDFRIRNVYRYGTDELTIVFESGEVNGRIYYGPLAFKIEVGEGDHPTTYTYTLPHAEEYAPVVPFYHSPFTCCYPVKIWINSDGAVPEVNDGNNLYVTRICDGTMPQFASFSSIGVEEILRIFGDTVYCNETWLYHPHDLEGKPYYDPYTQCLYATSEVRVENCSSRGKDVIVQFKYISYDRERVEQQQIHLAPGERKTVSAGTILKIRKRGNYVEVKLFHDGSERDSCRFNLEFRDFP